MLLSIAERRDQAAELYARGLTLTEVGQRLGVSPSTVLNYLAALGVDRRRNQSTRYPKPEPRICGHPRCNVVFTPQGFQVAKGRGRYCSTACARAAGQVYPIPRGACGTAWCTDASCGIKFGCCHCGCGQPTLIAKRNQLGAVAGEPTRFIRGHNPRARTLGARDAGVCLAAAIATTGLTRQEFARRAGVDRTAVTAMPDVAGYRISRDRCERIHTVLADELTALGEPVPAFDDLFTAEVDISVLPHRRRIRVRAAQPKDGRQFKTSRARANAAERARQRVSRVRDELERIKDESGLLEMSEVAAELLVHPAYIQQLAAKGTIGSRRVTIPESPRVRVLFEREQVRSLKQRWAHQGASPHGRGRLLLDPLQAVARYEAMGWLQKLMDRKGLSRDEAVDIVRGKITRRRKVIVPHNAGRKPRTASPTHHLEWLDAFLLKRIELLDEYNERNELGLLARGEKQPSNWIVAEAVAEDDFTHHRERWADEYSAPRHGDELDPRKARAAGQRVWNAIKPLLDAQTEIPAD